LLIRLTQPGSPVSKLTVQQKEKPP
jgi:hypothetical protein